jgi:UDP:flavonoid glycosyltransferase YjiC (YdhE family)
MQGLFEQYGPGLIETAYEAADGADVILSSFFSNVFAGSIAEKSGARHISAMLTPTPLATRSGPATISAPRPGSDSWVNYLLHKAVIERVDWSLTQGPANTFRQNALGLPFQGREEYLKYLSRTPILHGISPQVVPHPRDWPATTHTTGYWFLADDLGWQPTRELLDFLDAGDPPVFLSFGSMTSRDPNATTKLLADAVALSGKRAIIQAGWANLGEAALPDSVHLVGYVPHSWLLPRVAAAVHHGGAGTTAQVMATGIPAVAVPHMGDQPYWGVRIVQLGVGPRPIPRVKLTAPKLAGAIRQMTTDQGMRRRAAELGAKIRTENGVAAAADLIERYAAG